MRFNTQVGNWIAGWTSKHIAHNSTQTGKEKLIYLAKVTKKLTFDEYWKEYPQKRPTYTNDKNRLGRYGDNIYQPTENNSFIQIKNVYHNESKMMKDLGGKYVLICEEYYYFSSLAPLEIPMKVRPNIPKAQTAYGVITKDASEFINYVKQHAISCKECLPFSDNSYLPNR